jgi:hypothetical protein
MPAEKNGDLDVALFISLHESKKDAVDVDVSKAEKAKVHFAVEVNVSKAEKAKVHFVNHEHIGDMPTLQQDATESTFSLHEPEMDAKDFNLEKAILASREEADSSSGGCGGSSNSPDITQQEGVNLQHALALSLRESAGEAEDTNLEEAVLLALQSSDEKAKDQHEEEMQPLMVSISSNGNSPCSKGEPSFCQSEDWYHIPDKEQSPQEPTETAEAGAASEQTFEEFTVVEEAGADGLLKMDDKMKQYTVCAEQKMQSLSSAVDDTVLGEAWDEVECGHVFEDVLEKPISDVVTAMCLSKIPCAGEDAPEVNKLRIELDEQLSKLKAVSDGIRKAFSQNGFDISDVEIKEMWTQATDLVQSCGSTDSVESRGTKIDDASFADSEAKYEGR